MASSTVETADGHTEHTGHGGHHVFSDKTLRTTFIILVCLTLLTVILALIERGYGVWFGTRFSMPHIEFGWLSVPIALGIASVKSYYVLANFMGLRHDNPTYRLIFVATLIFVLIFFSFTYLDFRFRNTFEALSAVPADIEAQQVLEAKAEQDSIQAAYDASPFVAKPDTLLFRRPDAASTPMGTPRPGANQIDGTEALSGAPSTGPTN